MSKEKEQIICEMCKERLATHCHYKYWEEKPLKEKHRVVAKKQPELFQYLCSLCHAKVHGIDPRTSTLSVLVKQRDMLIKRKNRLENQIKNLGNNDIIIPENWEVELSLLYEQIKQHEKEIKKEVKNLPKDKYPTDWMLSIKGVKFNTIGKIFATIDNPLDKNTKTKSVASLWRLAGADPNFRTRKKGMSAEDTKKCGNPYFKKEMRLLSENLMKQRSPKYRDIFDKEKKKEEDLVKKYGTNVVVPNTNPPKTTIKKEMKTKKDKKTGKLKEVNAHAKNRALNKVGRIFLRDMYNEWIKLKAA